MDAALSAAPCSRGVHRRRLGHHLALQEEEPGAADPRSGGKDLGIARHKSHA